MKVVLFNVKYSANIGDGVIAECLERAIQLRTGWQVASIDLAGRTDWQAARQGRMRLLKLAVLQRLPTSARDAAVSLILGHELRSRLRPSWRRQLEGAEIAVFGGGQLIQDGDLNFPLKLSGAIDECRRLGLATAIFGVGASQSRSPRGFELLRDFLQDRAHVHIAVRDEASRAVLRKFGCEATLCHDPGLLASRFWPVTNRPRGRMAAIGLGVTHPVVLAHHASRRSEGQTVSAACELYYAMAKRLAEAGYEVICFTNGAAEDETLLETLAPRLQKADGAIRIARRCARPEELARLIASCDAVIAHRLHAAILAYSYRVPSIGLRWDDKLAWFFQSVGLEKRVAAFDRATARRIDVLVGELLAEGIDDVTHAQVLRETEAGIDHLVAALKKHSNQKTSQEGHRLFETVRPSVA